MVLFNDNVISTGQTKFLRNYNKIQAKGTAGKNIPDNPFSYALPPDTAFKYYNTLLFLTADSKALRPVGRLSRPLIVCRGKITVLQHYGLVRILRIHSI